MANASAGPIRLFVLGDARIETPRGVIEPTAELVFAAALYLILERKEPVARRTLEQLLWPSASRQSASHRLRQTLLKLRRCGIPVEPVGRSRLQLVSENIVVDFDEFVRNQNASIIPEQPLSFLPGYDSGFSFAFAEWLDSRKNEVQTAFSRLLLRDIAQARSAGSWPRIEQMVTKLLQIAPYNEEAVLVLAEAHAMRGAKLEGINILETYLNEVGRKPDDLKLPASVMRRRIAEGLAQRQLGDSSTPFVGRAKAMSQLTSLLQCTRGGAGRSAFVWGDAGIGKSRLLFELAGFAALQGVAIVRVCCRPSNRHRPMSPFIDLVPALRSLRGAIGCSPDTMKYLDRITHVSSANDAASAPPGEADFIYARVQQALFDLLDAVSEEKPLLIIVEDIHRMDDISSNLFSDMVPWSETRRILFAFTSREQCCPWDDGTEPRILELQLLPLDAESSAQLGYSIVEHHGRNVSNDEVDWWVGVAEGNPYFLGELANHWIETGERHVAPPSLSAVIRQRLARLQPDALQVLQACALLDANCSIDRIEGVLNYQHHELLQSINDLGNLGMLVLDSDTSVNPHTRLAARHELLANAAEQSLTAPARAFLHRRIALVLEAEVASNPSASILWDCAKHWQLSGNGSRAFQIASSCATHLMELGLCSSAAEAYEKSMAFCSSDTQRLELLEGQAAAYYRASDWARLAETAAKVRTLRQYLRPSDAGHDELELMELRASWQRGQLETARSRALACLDCAEADDQHRTRAGILALMLLDLACDHVSMHKTFARLEPLLTRTGSDTAFRFEAEMVYETVCGDLSKGLAAASSLIHARRNTDSVADLMRALTNGAVAARTAGEVYLAKQWLEEAIAVANSHKLPLATEVPIQILTSIALDENQLAEAKAWYQRLSDLPKLTFESRSIHAAVGVRIALAEGEVAQARSLLEGDVATLAVDPNPHRRTYGLALNLAVQIAEGSVPTVEAVNSLEASHLVSRRNPRQAFATFVLVTALRRLGRLKRASARLAEYQQTYRREPTKSPTHILKLLESFPMRTS